MKDYFKSIGFRLNIESYNRKKMYYLIIHLIYMIIQSKINEKQTGN